MLKRNFGNGEDAVSPVIGIILMVAVAVMLTAVFGSSLFGMGSDMEKTRIVVVTASQPSADTIMVTYYGGPDHNSIESITVMVNGLQVDDDDADTPSAIEGVDPGYTLTISNTSNMTANNGIANLNGDNLTITRGNNHVVVAATFVDGSGWVILDTYM